MAVNTDANPYQPNAVETDNASAKSHALKYLSHGIYLQLFVGIGCLAIAAVGVDTGPLFDGPKASGALLIGLGLNSLAYVHKYKRSIR